VKSLFYAAALALVCDLSWAASGPIVDTAFVADAAKRGAIIWDVRSAQEYGKGHLPGAVSIGDAAQVLRDANTEDFISTDKIERILGAAGIDPAREIVVYGNRGAWNPYFGLYAMQFFGGTHAYVFHGGIEEWRADGNAISTEAARLPPVSLKLNINEAVAVSTAQLIARLKNPDVQIIDARTPGEFRGEDIRAIRGGHIPGAINIPYEMNWVDPETPMKLAKKQVANSSGMSLKPADQLQVLYANLDPNKETIVYCQSGARASETAGVLQQLGFKRVKVYDSSWLGYAGKLSAPANNETFFNVGALNGRLTAMQRRIEQLESKLAASKAAK
jgi:thiosulfate/3-mercaptopyruvate sulfurtransferase